MKKTPTTDNKLFFFDEVKPIGWLIVKLAAEYEKEFLSRISSEKIFSTISKSDHKILKAIGSNILNSNEIARVNGITKQAVSQSIVSLEKRGFVHRKVVASDARAYSLMLTEKGHKLIDYAVRVSKDLDRITEKKLGVSELAKLKEALIKVESLFKTTS